MAHEAVGIVNEELAEARTAVADLRRELEAIADSTVLVPDDEHDAEGSTIGFERARVTALLAQSQRRVADLEAAVVRVGAGTYQCCERCGGDIDVERLAALPATRVCVSCAKRDRNRR
ncbi:MAG TPA: TraR/DksA C4-type zinc finger protein [Acidimicrobiales bacterium]|jgi:RNA polymerase-binding transcription factor DksA|nr:TraR/DksA C4-type zinc finger protein [Acidimicrobiales bacterium]